MKALATVGFVLVLLLGTAVASPHGDEEKLPEGPIRERHELMEDIGGNAKKIGDTIKAGKTDGIAERAEAIRKASDRILELFPEGSTHPNSRAKENIWGEGWEFFERDARALGERAAALAEAAREDGDVKAASRDMFEVCKSCHDSFRKEED